MSSEDSLGVTLALVDPSLLSSWEGMVKRGEECSLLLMHSKGKITATLQSTTPTPSSAMSSSPSSTSSADKRKKTKGSKEKRLKALLAYHQRLVVEKGLPPSRLMEQQAAASSAIAPASHDQSPGLKKKLFQCHQCDFSSDSQRGLKVHAGRSHKLQQASEILREELEVSLTLSQLSDEQEKDISSVNADTSSTLDDIVLPHYCGPSDTPIISEALNIFACDGCFHIWRTEDQVKSCECSRMHTCLPACLYADVVSSECDPSLRRRPQFDYA